MAPINPQRVFWGRPPRLGRNGLLSFDQREAKWLPDRSRKSWSQG